MGGEIVSLEGKLILELLPEAKSTEGSLCLFAFPKALFGKFFKIKVTL